MAFGAVYKPVELMVPRSTGSIDQTTGEVVLLDFKTNCWVFDGPSVAVAGATVNWFCVAKHRGIQTVGNSHRVSDRNIKVIPAKTKLVPAEVEGYNSFTLVAK